MSMASKSTSGAAKDVDMMCARSKADTAPEPVNSAMKLLRLTCALRKMASAAFWPSLPADTSALPKPGSAMKTGFFSACSVTDMVLETNLKKESSFNDYQM